MLADDENTPSSNKEFPMSATRRSTISGNAQYVRELQHTLSVLTTESNERLTVLNMKLDALQRQQTIDYEAARRLLRDIHSKVKQSETSRAIENNNSVDVVFWSGGKLGLLRLEIESGIKKLETNQQTENARFVQRIIHKDGGELIERLWRIVEQAQIAQHNSQFCEGYATRLLKRLAGEWFGLQEPGPTWITKGEDRLLIFKVSDRFKNEITVTICPSRDVVESCTAHYDFVNTQRFSEARHQQRQAAILRALRDDDLVVSHPECVTSSLPALADMGEMSRVQPDSTADSINSHTEPVQTQQDIFPPSRG